MGLDDLFNDMGEFLSRQIQKHEARRVADRIPIREEWRPLLKDMREGAKSARAAERKARGLHRQFWARVEADTQIYDHMRISANEQLIEVLRDEDLDEPYTPTDERVPD